MAPITEYSKLIQNYKHQIFQSLLNFPNILANKVKKFSSIIYTLWHDSMEDFKKVSSKINNNQKLIPPCTCLFICQMTSLLHFLSTTLENTASLYMYSSCLEAQTLAVNPKLKYKLIFHFYFKIIFNQLGLKDTHKVRQ